MTYFDATRFYVFVAWKKIYIPIVIGMMFLPVAFLPTSVVEAQSIPDLRTQGVKGRMVTWRAGKVSTQVPGLVRTLGIRVGQRVGRGDVLAILDTSQIELDVKVAQSNLEVSRARLAVAKTEEALKRNIFDRQTKLKQSIAFNKSRYDDAYLRLQIAIANKLRAAAEVAGRQANLKRKELDITLSTIRSPYGGVIRRVLAQTGTFITAELPHIIEMVDDTSLEIEIDIPVKLSGTFQPGQQFSFRVNGRTRGQARVRAILPDVNRRTQTRPVRLAPLEEPSISSLGLGQVVTIFSRGP